MSTDIKINPNGFREYDARWLYEKDINLSGLENLGKGLGTQIIKHTKKVTSTTKTCTVAFTPSIKNPATFNFSQVHIPYRNQSILIHQMAVRI